MCISNTNKKYNLLYTCFKHNLLFKLEVITNKYFHETFIFEFLLFCVKPLGRFD